MLLLLVALPGEHLLEYVAELRGGERAEEEEGDYEGEETMHDC